MYITRQQESGWVAGGCGWRQKARSWHGAVEGWCGGGGVVATRGRNPWQTHHQVVAHGHHGHHADPVRGAPTAITHKRARAALWFDAQPLVDKTTVENDVGKK